jgi:hypothetical protein
MVSPGPGPPKQRLPASEQGESVKYYKLGEFPKEKPQWLIDELNKTELYKTQDVNEDLELWLLDGSKESMSVPAAYLLQMPPGYVLFRHGHPCYRWEVVVQGSLEIGDGRVATTGDVFTALPGELYGPHTAGPEGCTTIEVFSELDAMFRLLVEGPDGQPLEIETRNGELPPDFVPYRP